jgi:hypothetical protein
VIELYAVVEHPGPPLPKIAPLRFVEADGITAVCAPVADEEVDHESLWRYETVVEALMCDRDLLPFRYGTRFEDTSAAARALQERRDELIRALDRVRGAVELSLRVAAPARDQEGGGALAMRAVHAPLSSLARASLRFAPRPSELLRAAYLVDRDEVERFVEQVARLQRSQPTLRLLCTGPWPPYSFPRP